LIDVVLLRPDFRLLQQQVTVDANRMLANWGNRSLRIEDHANPGRSHLAAARKKSSSMLAC